MDGVRLPTGYYFGMSATTGDLSDNHDIIAVKLYELDDSSTDTVSTIVHEFISLLTYAYLLTKFRPQKIVQILFRLPSHSNLQEV